MRTFIFALAAIVPASCVIDRAGAADRLPAFDIARNCNEETAGSGIGGPAACTKDETDAKNELAKRWSQFGATPASAKNQRPYVTSAGHDQKPSQPAMHRA